MEEFIKTKAAFLCRFQPKVCKFCDSQFDKAKDDVQTIAIDCEHCGMSPALRM